MRVTHPPLSREQFLGIAARRKSDDALLLLREVERLKALERGVREALTMPAGTRGREVRQQLLDAIAGKLPAPHAFGLDLPRDSKAERRGQLASDSR